MIVDIGLPLALIAAGAATNSGSTQLLSDNFVISGPRRRATAPRARSDRLAREPAGQCTGRLRVDTVTIPGSARILDTTRPDGNRHPRQRQRHCADGAYLAVPIWQFPDGVKPVVVIGNTCTSRCTDPGLQGENPGKEKS